MDCLKCDMMVKKSGQKTLNRTFSQTVEQGKGVQIESDQIHDVLPFSLTARGTSLQ